MGCCAIEMSNRTLPMQNPVGGIPMSILKFQNPKE